jgi:sulfhydrogenase subunit alpha
VPYTHALHSTMKARGPYFAGPLARYNLNFDRLTPLARETAKEAGLGPVCKNPFKSIIVRAVEMLYAVEEALAIIEAYERPAESALKVAPRVSSGCAATEAPRGLLYHRYSLDDNGLIQEAKIVPPTSQNQGIIEADLYHFVSEHLDLPEDKLTWQCEQLVRNYDPCISCATHFLKLKFEHL